MLNSYCWFAQGQARKVLFTYFYLVFVYAVAICMHAYILLTAYNYTGGCNMSSTYILHFDSIVQPTRGLGFL